MLGNKKWKTIVLHTAHEGVERDYIYQLMQPVTIRSISDQLEQVTASGDKSWISFETTEGVIVFRVWHITGFDLGDPA